MLLNALSDLIDYTVEPFERPFHKIVFILHGYAIVMHNDIHLGCWHNDVSSALEITFWPYMVLYWHVLVFMLWLSKIK